MSNTKVSREFNQFFHEKLRPIIESVTAKRKRALFRSLAIALACFGAMALVLYFLFAPKLELLRDYNITFWPLFLLFPCSIALLAFSCAYLLVIRNMVGDFKTSMLKEIAAFIHPGILYDNAKDIPEQTMAASLLFDGLDKPMKEKGHFRGAVGSARVEFSSVRVARRDEDGKKRTLSGIYYTATYDRHFKAPLIILPISAPVNLARIQESLSDSGAAKPDELTRIENIQEGRQTVAYVSDLNETWNSLPSDLVIRLAVLRNSRGMEFHFSRLAHQLHLAMLTPDPTDRKNSLLDDFNFVNYREFCHDARLCLEQTRTLGDEPEIWV